MAGGDNPEDKGQSPAAQLAEDAELIAEFVQEAEQYFTLAERALLELEKAPDDPDAIGVIFRAFHTVKGVSALLGLNVISEFAHEAESFLIPVRDGAVRFGGDCPQLALAALDMLRSLVGCVGVGTTQLLAPAGYDELKQRLAAGARVTRTQAPQQTTPSLAAADSGAKAAEPVAATRALSSPAQHRSGRPGYATAKRKHSLRPARAAAPHAVASSEDAWIRVRAERLDALLDMVGELVISQSMVTEDAHLYEGRLRELLGKVNQCAKIVRGLQDLSLSLRMVPLRATFQKMGRVVRDTAQKSRKLAELCIDGEETEVDRKLADMLADPLVHMIRNAVDHGIELPGERTAAGKPAIGKIELIGYHSGGNVVLELRDDGRGLAREKIVAKAKLQGLIAKDARLADHEILNLIFSPGFSTNETVTDISGRGVGMDVVKRAIEALSGRIEITSHAGLGTTFAIHLPLTLAITDGMLVRVGSQRYIIPTANIDMSFRPEAAQLKTLSGQGEMVMLRGVAIPMLRVHRAFGVLGAVEDPTLALVVVVGSGNGMRALLVDDLLGKYQVVTKSLGAAIGKAPGISGGAILGDGHVGLVIDPQGLIRASEQPESPAAPRAMDDPSAPQAREFSASELGGKHLTFFLGREEYGIPILQVQEIVRMLGITPLPGSPPYLRGVANLRGRILPVIDLRIKLGMPAVSTTDDSRVIVISCTLGFIGMIVDRVSEVEEIGAEIIGQTPSLAAGAEYVLGVGISGQRAQFLLDIGRIVGARGGTGLKPQASL